MPIFRNGTSLFPKVILEKTENTVGKNARSRWKDVSGELNTDLQRNILSQSCNYEISRLSLLTRNMMRIYLTVVAAQDASHSNKDLYLGSAAKDFKDEHRLPNRKMVSVIQKLTCHILQDFF